MLLFPKFKIPRLTGTYFNLCCLVNDPDDIIQDDINIFYSNFRSAILNAACQSIPRRKKKHSEKYVSNSWWNESCEAAVKSKKSAYKKWLRQKSDENFADMKYEKNTLQ